MQHTSIRVGVSTVIVLSIHILILWVFEKASPVQFKHPNYSLTVRFTENFATKNTVVPAKSNQNAKLAEPENLLKNNSASSTIGDEKVRDEEKISLSNDAFIASVNASDWLEKNPLSYLLREEIDLAAEPLIDLGVQFARLFPIFSGTVIVEFWVDSTGKVSRVDIKQGRTLVDMNVALADMLEFHFLPAQREGVLVDSRKLIVIDTNALVP